MPVRKRPRTSRRPAPLAVAKILAWADAYHRRKGEWPKMDSGPVAESLGDTWRRLDSALRVGLRGLEGGSSLARLLAERRQVRHQGQLPPMKRKEILAWADAHHKRTGTWPTGASGPIAEAPGETW